MNIRPFTKGTKIKEYIAGAQNVLYDAGILLGKRVDKYDMIRNALNAKELIVNDAIRTGYKDKYASLFANHFYEYTKSYNFYSGYRLKPGVEYMLCFVDNHYLTGHALYSNIETGILDYRYKYLGNIGVFLYRFDPKYSDHMFKNECVIDSYCVFNLYGDYLAPYKPAPRPLEDIEYLRSIKNNKHSIKKLDKNNILSEEEKKLLFKNNFYDNIYSDYYAFIHTIRCAIGDIKVEDFIVGIMNNQQTVIIKYPVNLYIDTTVSISKIALNSREQKKCPIDIPRSLELIATREDEIYHFHAEAPITHKPDIEYKAIPSITYTTS